LGRFSYTWKHEEWNGLDFYAMIIDNTTYFYDSEFGWEFKWLSIEDDVIVLSCGEYRTTGFFTLWRTNDEEGE
jgi:predicted enzyme related to lactoylglutathione lyase